MLAIESSSTATMKRFGVDFPVEKIQLVGRIVAEPKFYPYQSGDNGNWIFPLKCTNIGFNENWNMMCGQIRVRISSAKPDYDFKLGQRLCVSGELRRRSFPGGEPFELIVRKQAWEMLEPASGFSLKRWMNQLRQRAAERLSVGIESHPTQLAVLKALLLGYRKEIPHTTFDQFRRTGAVHIFAISGLHVGMVGFLIIIVLKALGIPCSRWGLLLLPLLFIYIATTGMKSSALRAFTMASVYFVAPLIRRKPDIPTAVAVAAVLLLWMKPSQIQSIGFILSFTVVSFIIMAFAIIPKGWIFKGRGWINATWNYIASLMITSIAAGMASIPLIALYFGTYSSVALIGNLFVVPLTFVVVLCGWLSILIPFASEIYNHAALVSINGMLGMVGWLSEFPGASWNVPTPSLAALLIWYLGWICFFTHANSDRQRLVSIGVALFSIIIAVIPELFV